MLWLTRKKPIKRKKPLKRTGKPIAKRSVFKAHGENPLKSYRRRFTDYQVMIRAQIAPASPAAKPDASRDGLLRHFG